MCTQWSSREGSNDTSCVPAQDETGEVKNCQLDWEQVAGEAKSNMKCWENSSFIGEFFARNEKAAKITFPSSWLECQLQLKLPQSRTHNFRVIKVDVRHGPKPKFAKINTEFHSICSRETNAAWEKVLKTLKCFRKFSCPSKIFPYFPFLS